MPKTEMKLSCQRGMGGREEAVSEIRMCFIIPRNLSGNRLKAFAATDTAAGNKQKDYLSHVHSVLSLRILNIVERFSEIIAHINCA